MSIYTYYIYIMISLAEQIANALLKELKEKRKKEITLEEIIIKYKCSHMTARQALKILMLLLKEQGKKTEYRRGGKLIIE